eukprot:scaffold2042_cov123-Cylindrotheca_fusiformis.AAC.4
MCKPSVRQWEKPHDDDDDDDDVPPLIAPYPSIQQEEPFADDAMTLKQEVLYLPTGSVFLFQSIILIKCFWAKTWCGIDVFKKLGFVQSKFDPHILYRNNMMVILQVDDCYVGGAANPRDILDDLIRDLQESSLGFFKLSRDEGC